jgi:triosephosphate isomerase (TIM)
MSDRRPLIAGNWKMYKTCDEAVETITQLKHLVDGVSEVDIMIAPAFTALSQVSAAVSGSNIHIGAQNVSWHEEGAYTGEISPAMVVSTGCSHVIIGHSERRQYYNETDETVNQRIAAAIRHGLVPVFCVGETEAQRESDATFSVLDKQVTIGLQDIALEDLATLVIAYEPVWAIGTGKTATTEQAQEVHQFLRSLLEKAYNADFSESVRILYGGSVKPKNIAELMSMPDVDGALVGGASLDADTFSQIVKY